MKPAEIKIAAAALLLIALTAVALVYGKPRLGNPGLVLENKGVTNEVGEVVRDQRVFLPPKSDSFTGFDSPVTKGELALLPADTLFGRKEYRERSGFHATLSAVLMKTDRTSIHRPQTCVTGQGWEIGKTEIISIPIAKPVPHTLQATALQMTNRVKDNNGVEHDLTGWYVFWFVSEENVVPRLGEAHWLLAKNLLVSGVLQRWGYVSCHAYGRPGEEGLILARMKRLIASAVPEIQTTIGQPQQSASLASKPPLN